MLLRRATTDSGGLMQPDGSLRRTIDHRLVWIVMTNALGRSVTLYDAHTGKFLVGMYF